MTRLKSDFYTRDVLEVAPELLGKKLQINLGHSIQSCFFTEIEIYRGTEDKACHASKGRTARTEIMFAPGGYVYVYLIYGMYWMLNIVTGPADNPQAILVRGINNINGPGRVGKFLNINKSFYGEDLTRSNRIWIENAPLFHNIIKTPRIGIDYAGEPWVSKKWRYMIASEDIRFDNK